MIILMRAIAVLIMVGPAYAQYGGGYSQGTDSAQIDLMNAQAQLLRNYARCLQTASDANPCRPPQPIQVSAPNQPPPQNRGGFSQGMLASAQTNLMSAQTQGD